MEPRLAYDKWDLRSIRNVLDEPSTRGRMEQGALQEKPLEAGGILFPLNCQKPNSFAQRCHTAHLRPSSPYSLRSSLRFN